MRRVIVVLAVLGAVGLSGCATIAGTATGLYTGAFDLPAETYRHNQEAFEEHPILFAPDVLVLGPVGAALGPVFGLAKGVALDVQWARYEVDYDEVFGTYSPASIWRPYTLDWMESEEGGGG